jgi:RND family efflux transporter MFP subunit
MKRRYPLAAVGLVVCSLISCSKPAESSAPKEETALVVPVAKATLADLTGRIVLSAEFEPYQEIDLMAKVSGYVKSINVDIGDRVREGQLLATLEIPEMADDAAKASAAVQTADAEIGALRDEVHRVESNHNLTHLSYTRIEGVAIKEKGLVPQQEVDEAYAHDLAAEAQIAEAKSRLRAAGQRLVGAQAEESRIKTMFKYTSITAPFEGVVTKRYANTGSMIQAGTASQTQAMPIIKLSQNNRLRLLLPVPESAVSRIHLGQTLDVRIAALGRTIPGRVARFTGSLQMATRTMDTQVDVANPNLTLLPGMYAEVDLNLDERRNVLTVPIDAIEGTGAAAHAYTLKKGRILTVPVIVGLETAQKVEIQRGLNAGDLVITGRHAGLKDGQKVTPKLVEGEG